MSPLNDIPTTIFPPPKLLAFVGVCDLFAKLNGSHKADLLELLSSLTRMLVDMKRRIRRSRRAEITRVHERNGSMRRLRLAGLGIYRQAMHETVLQRSPSSTLGPSASLSSANPRKTGHRRHHHRQRHCCSRWERLK